MELPLRMHPWGEIPEKEHIFGNMRLPLSGIGIANQEKTKHHRLPSCLSQRIPFSNPK
jgi:hypothetical protein